MLDILRAQRDKCALCHFKIMWFAQLLIRRLSQGTELDLMVG